MFDLGGGGFGDFTGIQDKDISLRAGRKTEINNYLQELLSDEINQKDTEKINQRKEEILRKIKEEFGGSFDLSTGGSYSRHTYVNGLSDIDILINLGNYSDSKIPEKENSKKVLEYVAEILRKKYPRTEIVVGKMAVTLRFRDGIEIQVLPAFRYYGGYKIPDPKSSRWITTFPDRFKERLTRLNRKYGNRVKPIIKIVKYLLNKNNVEISSYHLENIALEAFENYSGNLTYSDMVIHLLNYAKTRVLKRVSDPSGQSDHIDEYLGRSHSPNRSNLAEKIGKLESRLREAETRDDWERIVNGQ